MKIKTITFCVVVVCFFSTRAYAQSDPTVVVTRFFQEHNKSGIDQALSTAFATNQWIGEQKDSINSLKAQLNNIVKLLGKYQGYELIETKKIKDSYLIQIYLVKFERQPLRYTFVFYKPNTAWQLQNFEYGADVAGYLK